MNIRRTRRRIWQVSIPLIILAAIVSDISGFKFGYYLFAGMLLAGCLAGCGTLRAWWGPEARPERNKGRWLRSWELVTAGAILAAIVSDILGSRFGYFACGFMALVGMVACDRLGGATSASDGRESSSSKQ